MKNEMKTRHLQTHDVLFQDYVEDMRKCTQNAAYKGADLLDVATVVM